MSEIAIRVDGLSKRYSIGRMLHGSLREQFAELLRSGARARGEDFWALLDLSFEVPRGAALGIVGRNGAGKSTLLKLLSRITHPTQGRIEIHGRVASLLEVGTGFHPELTGRENILLNGTILGMTRQEVRRRLDAIVDFSGVSQFLDTPVKHYSSGMYVRLAFSVAAHLEPEILIVDEVLAVGDAEFQAKCLGKMDAVTQEGRTVLLVSHNIGALRRLCTSGIVLDRGQLVAQGSMERCIEAYAGIKSRYRDIAIADRTDRTGTGEVVFTRVDVLSMGEEQSILRAGEELEVVFHLTKQATGALHRALVWFQVMKGEEVFFTGNSELYGHLELTRLRHRVSCTIPRLPLFAGRYELRVFLMVDGRRSDYLEHAVEFEVDDARFFPTGKTPVEKVGVLVDQAWRIE
jgi:lipopolysaccharide transport system ATP-binding protein